MAQATKADPTSGCTPDKALDSALDTQALEHLLGLRLALADVPLRRAFQRTIGEPFGLKPVEFSLLLLLAANPGAAPKQLARTLHLTPPKVTLLVDRLAARALVERTRHAADGRAQHLLLTRQGLALARRVRALSLTMEDAALQALSPGERSLLAELLLKLARAALPAAGDGPSAGSAG